MPSKSKHDPDRLFDGLPEPVRNLWKETKQTARDVERRRFKRERDKERREKNKEDFR